MKGKCKIHGELNIETGKKEKNGKYFFLRCIECTKNRLLLRKIDIGTHECKKHGWLFGNDIKINVKGYRTCRICHRESASTARNKDRTKVNEWVARDRKDYPQKYRQWVRDCRARNGEEGKQKRYEEHILLNYKLTKEKYYEMLNEQNGKCKICKEVEVRKSSGSDKEARLCIDHCHKTGIVRGLLCHDCNTGLGKFKDSIELLCRSIEYLEIYEST